MSAADTISGYRYLFRSRVIGNYEWACPCCGHFNRSHLRPSSYTLRCFDRTCNRLFGLGHALHEIPMAAHSTPDDYVIPSGIADSFPEGDVGRWWRNGKLMHCVHTATGALAIPDLSGPADEAPPIRRHV